MQDVSEKGKMLHFIQGLHPPLAANVRVQKPQTLEEAAQSAEVFEHKYAIKNKSAWGSPHTLAYEVEKKPKFAEFNDKKFVATPFLRNPMV